MKTTGKSTIYLMLCGMLMMLTMYNCKNNDSGPLALDQAAVDKLNAIKMEEVSMKNPDPVTVSESKIEVSAKAEALNKDINNLSANAPVTANMTAAASEVTVALTPAEITTMSSISAETMAAIEAGGAIPENLKAILTKAEANAALKANLPTVTLPVVSSAAKAGRIGSTESAAASARTGATAAVQISDACIAAAEKAYQTKKNQLDADRAAALAVAASSYSTALALIGPAQTACTSPLAAKYTALKNQATRQGNTLGALLDANKAALGSAYALLKVQIYLQQLAYFSSLNALQAADTQACIAAGQLSTASAQAAYGANTAAVEASYAQAIADAMVARDAAAETCHNQGGGTSN